MPPHVLSTLPAIVTKLQDTSQTNRNISKKRLEYQPKPRMSRDYPFNFTLDFRRYSSRGGWLCAILQTERFMFLHQRKLLLHIFFGAVTQTYVFSSSFLFSEKLKTTIYCVGGGGGGMSETLLT